MRLPAYDEGSAEHRDLTQRAATVMGACMPGPIQEWTDAFKAWRSFNWAQIQSLRVVW